MALIRVSYEYLFLFKLESEGSLAKICVVFLNPHLAKQAVKQLNQRSDKLTYQQQNDYPSEEARQITIDQYLMVEQFPGE